LPNSEVEFAFEEKIKNNLEYNRDLIEVRTDSLREECYQQLDKIINKISK
jgi:3-dehydroquinate dehydratase